MPRPRGRASTAAAANGAPSACSLRLSSSTAKSENYPFSVKPEKKVTVQDLLAIFRDAYDNTEYDMTRGYIAVNRKGETIKSPVIGPYLNADLQELLQSQARADDLLADGHLSSDHAVPRLAPRSHRRHRLARLRQSGHDAAYAVLLRDLKMPDSYMVDGRWGYQERLRLVGVPAGRASWPTSAGRR